MQAIFLDRDGTLNRERADYVRTWEELEILPGALDALRVLAQLGIPIAVVSNQSVIGRGLVTQEQVDSLHARLADQVRTAGGRIDAFFVCPHKPDEGCACRKPRPGLLEQAACSFRVDLAQCVFVGDAITDYQAAQAAGCRSLLVATGRQGAALPDLLGSSAESILLPDIAAAADRIEREFRAMRDTLVTALAASDGTM